ncbi:cysteine synthase family protein [Fluviispira vulneris]|uniref:cysteine synthase family protein n=1 Tax=Fluviispira vulneris TaxID=2763012 RepID=UPI0016489D42|nr:cysteine synthase family protein [Fluviispira vulneris]
MNILECTGNTPIVNIEKINKFCGTNVQVKLEKTNPAGSIKDRAAKYIIDYAEENNLLKPRGTIIESSSGNFGISLAMIGAARGYKVIILVDPKATDVNVGLIKAYGAEVIVVDKKDDAGSYHKTRIQLANELARKIENSYRPDQCFNILSSIAHKETTAKEIFEQTQGEISGVVAAVSTGGQIGGIAEYFAEKSTKYYITCVDAYGSSIFGGESHSYKIPGVGLSWTPRNIKNVNNIDYVYRIRDEDSYIAARILCRNEGILVGVSSGAVLLTALKLSQEIQNKKPLIAILGDSGERYLNTLFNDEWLKENDIPLDSNLELLYKLLSSIEDPQVSPNIVENYRDDLIDSLSVPKTTMTHF